MRLDHAFVRLPLRFDPVRLAAEVDAFPASAWRAHPEGAPGNTALQLVSAGGDPDDDATQGEMRPTPHLLGAPYLRQVLASLGAAIGRTRFMRIEAEGDLALHADINYYWRDRLRVHVPVVTREDVAFHCGGHTVHMGAGETWVFDTWRPHGVDNPSDARRVHLVVDTVGSPALWDLIGRGATVPGTGGPAAPDRVVAFDPDASPEPVFESCNRSRVMSPWEQEAQVRALLADVRGSGRAPAAAVASLEAALRALRVVWRELWAVHGDGASGWSAYEAEIRSFARTIDGLVGAVTLPNGLDAAKVARAHLVAPALDLPAAAGRVPAAAPAPTPTAARTVAARSRIDRPVFVVSSPRAGSTMLFEALARSGDAWTVGGESHHVIERLRRLHPARSGFHSNRLTAPDAEPQVVERLAASFLAELRDRDGGAPPAEGRLRLVEKTPKNALRVPFLAAAFPDARFVYLYRDPRETVSSMLDAWRSGRFVTYPDLPGWSGPPWSLLLTPGWRELAGRGLPEIVAEQWRVATTQLLDDLEELDPERWCVTSYDRLLGDPDGELARICSFCDLGWDAAIRGPLPLSRHTLDTPQPEKWRRNAEALKAVWPIVDETAHRTRELFARPPATRPARPPATTRALVAPDVGPADGDPRSFRSVHTTNLPEVLGGLGATVLVSTYQSGRVIALRPDGRSVNTHFRHFESPMGMAYGRNGLAIGTKSAVWRFRDQPAVAAKLEPQGRFDAAFLPAAAHVTGNIQVHELAHVGDELWVVNTRFSCLATLDDRHSFVPRWRPPFVTALAPEDRCHLNGMAVDERGVRFVTALGTTDVAGGWRDRKTDGGVVVDVASGEIVVRGLSMPHSPRLRDGRLWVLDSGRGAVCVADPLTGAVETVTELPGFTRGLAFAGDLAFVGLSQVRESVFGGIPLSERLTERLCGIWVLDARSGATVGFLRFEGAVQEIFDVQILPGVRFPELCEPGDDLVGASFVLPEEALAQVSDLG